MIDTHCHIQTKDYDADRDAVLAQAAVDGVEAMIVPAIDEPSFDATLAMTSFASPRIACAIGVHPHHASEVTGATLERVAALMTNVHVVAVGEIGLDYHYDYSPRDIQQQMFTEQIRIANRAGKPVIVHNRESDEDVLRILSQEQNGKLSGVLHCFSGTEEVMQRALDIGLHISFTGNITFKNSTLGGVVAAVPLDRVMLETDSPWMSPPPWRGKRNEPGRIRLVAEKIAEIKGLSANTVIMQTTMNAKRFFGLATLLFCMLVMRSNGWAQPTPTGRPSVAPGDTARAVKAEAPPMPPDFFRTLAVGGSVGTSTFIPAEGATGEANLFTNDFKIVYMITHPFGIGIRYWHFRDDLYGYTPRLAAENARIDADTNIKIKTHIDPSFDLSDHYNNLDIEMRFLFNPRNRITFGGLLGGTMMFFNQPWHAVTFSIPAVFFALVLAINLPFEWGMVQPYGEYRVYKQVGNNQSVNGNLVFGNNWLPVTSLGLMYYFPENFTY